MERKKIACIGAGNIGGEVASQLAMQEAGDIVIVDTPGREGIAKGKAADIQHASALTLNDIRISGTGDPAAIENAEICVISAGLARHSDISRDELLEANARITVSIGESIRKYAPESFCIMVTNPLDVMTYVLWRATGLPTQKIIGMAGMLDSARFRAYISDALDCSIKDVNALVLGSHGDLMVPVISYCTVNGIPVRELLSETELQKITERTRFAGGDLVKLMGTSAYFAAAQAVVTAATSYLNDHNRILPCSVYLQGEYSLEDVFIGVPAVIAGEGVQRVIELRLTDDEMRQLKTSAEYVASICKRADAIIG